MNSTKKAARVAGLLYLLNGVTGFFSIIYIPSTFIVSGDATATANRIMASQMLFRIGMVSELICAASFIFLARALYHLLKGVSKRYASLMVTLAVVTVPIMFLNVLNEIAVLELLSGANFLSVFDKRQLDALVMLFLNLHGTGLVLAMLGGLFHLPFGILVYRSGFLPRLLGVWLIAAFLGYLSDSLTFLLLPRYALIVSQFASVPQAGELAMILWLLIRGAKDQPLDDPRLAG